MNQIIIKNLELFAYHGVHDFEKLNGQPFCFDVVVTLLDDIKYSSDNINEVLSYSEVIKTIKNTTECKSYNLIETLGYHIVKDLFLAFDKIQKLDITIKKPKAPINEKFDYVGIRIVKNRGEL